MDDIKSNAENHKKLGKCRDILRFGSLLMSSEDTVNLGSIRGRWSSCRGDPDAMTFNHVLIPASWLTRPPRQDLISYVMPLTAQRREEWNTEYWDPLDASQKPVRCFSCSRILGHRYTPYWLEVNKYGNDVEYVLESLGIEPQSYCCKQMLMTYTSIPVQSVGKGHKVICE